MFSLNVFFFLGKSAQSGRNNTFVDVFCPCAHDRSPRAHWWEASNSLVGGKSYPQEYIKDFCRYFVMGKSGCGQTPRKLISEGRFNENVAFKKHRSGC